MARTAGWKDNLLIKAKKNPHWWIQEVLGDRLWSKQIEICKSVVEHERTAVPASFGVGKTFLAARIVLWWLFNFKPGKVITTAPTSRQVKDLLWKEIRTAHAKAKMPLGGTPLTLSLTLNDEQFAVGFSTDDTNMDMFTGYHSPNQLVVFDQAGGIPPMVWDAAEGLMTSDFCRWLVISNTAIVDCEFANICMPDRHSKHGDWNIIPITAEESPNVVAGKNIYPGLVSHDWVRKKEKSWGKEDPLYRIFVKAEFVPTAQMSVIPYPYLIKAYENEGVLGNYIEIGLDVARSGLDSTVWAVRSGSKLLALYRVTGNNTMQVAGMTVELVRDVQIKYNLPVNQIKVDIIGLGAGVYDRLVELNLPVTPVNNAESLVVVDRERYLNVRAEMAWSFRRRMELEGVGLKSVYAESDEVIEYLRGDLQAIKYQISSSGKIQIQAKEDLKLELGRSPDCWDAVVLAFETPGGGVPFVEFVTDKSEGQTELTISGFSPVIISDDEWLRLLGVNVDIDDPSFH